MTAHDGQAAMERLRMLAIERIAGDHVAQELLIRAGLDALLSGLDSPSLRLLAGLGTDEESEAPMIFDDVVTELALVPGLGHDQAGARWQLTRWLVQLVGDGELDTVAGARRIAESWRKLDCPEELSALVGWLTEYDDWSPVWSAPREFYVDRIRDEARRLSSLGSARPSD